MWKWIKTTGLLFLLPLLLAGCDAENESAVLTPATSETANIQNDDNGRSLSLVVHPYDTPSRIITNFQPLADRLSALLERRVEIMVAISYGDQIHRIVSGDADLAYMGPTPYLRAHDQYLADQDNNLQLIAAEAGDNGAGYQSVLVTRSDSKLNRVADIRGHTFAFGSPRSFSSHYVPRVMLAREGVHLADLRDYAYLGRHERVALAVLHGDFDAGGLRKAIANRYRQRGLRIIAESPVLPPHVIVASPGLDPEIVQQIRDSLVDTDSLPKAVFKPFGEPVRFVKVNDSEFDLARAVVSAIESGCAQTRVPW